MPGNIHPSKPCMAGPRVESPFQLGRQNLQTSTVNIYISFFFWPANVKTIKSNKGGIERQ